MPAATAASAPSIRKPWRDRCAHPPPPAIMRRDIAPSAGTWTGSRVPCLASRWRAWLSGVLFCAGIFCRSGGGDHHPVRHTNGIAWWRRAMPIASKPRLRSVTARIAVILLLMMRAGMAGPAVIGARRCRGGRLGARSGHENPFWQALGVVYLGLPALALVSLRTFPQPRRAGHRRLVPDRMGDRYRRADLRQPDRRAAHGAGLVAVQDLGGNYWRQRYGCGCLWLLCLVAGRGALDRVLFALVFSVSPMPAICSKVSSSGISASRIPAP